MYRNMYVARIFYILTGFFTLKEIKYLIAVSSTKPDASLLPTEGCDLEANETIQIQDVTCTRQPLAVSGVEISTSPLVRV